jgi:hypothetical protein
MVALIPRLLRAQSVAKVTMWPLPRRSCPCKRPTAWLGSRSGTARWVDPLKDQRSAVEDRVDGEREGNGTEERIGSGLGQKETTDEHGRPSQLVDDKHRDDVAEPGAAASGL